MTYNTGMVFHSLFRAHHNAIHASLTAQGLGDIGSPRLLDTLWHCKEQGEFPSQRELAELLHVSAATIATSLKSLERHGYVERSVDPEDSRRNRIALTPKAVNALEASHAVFRSVEEFMFSGFSEEEIDQINYFHLRMLQNLYQIGGDKDCCPPPERMDKPL